MNRESPLWQRLEEEKVIAVLVIDREEDAVPLAESLLAGGISAMELTLRTDCALAALRRIREKVPEMTAGIGTILTAEQLDQVVEAGAAFGVAPSTNPELIRYAAEKGLPFAPGVMTPTDIDIAIREGCRLLKFFPAESSGGIPHLNSIAAPYAHLDIGFVPLGGIGPANMSAYLDNPHVIAVGGSWLAPKDAIRSGDWERIRKSAEEARQQLG